MQIHAIPKGDAHPFNQTSCQASHDNQSEAILFYRKLAMYHTNCSLNPIKAKHFFAHLPFLMLIAPNSLS